MTTTQEKKNRWNFKPVIGITLISLLICGFLYPFLVTGIGQILFPYQANGEIVQLNGKPVGSELIAQTFNSPLFFHARNDSASGVDPHITLDNVYFQIPGVSNATGIPENELKEIVAKNKEGALWIFGVAYVNVLRLNLVLIQIYPSVYTNFSQ
jgi:K+-transporting ATPase ATPase C chain